MNANPYYIETGARERFTVPAIGNVRADEREDETGELLAQQQTQQSVFIFAQDLTKADKSLWEVLLQNCWYYLTV